MVTPQAAFTFSITSGLSGSPALSASRSLHRVPLQVLEDEHPPDGRRGAERRHPVGGQHLHQLAAVEAGVVVEEDGGAGVERGEEVGPGVLGPARRGDVHVDVALLQAQPVHRREVAHRVAELRVDHQLRLPGRTAGEVEQDGLRRERVAVRDEGGPLAVGLLEAGPARHLGRRPRGAGTSRRVPRNFSLPALSVMTWPTRPRSIRSARSSGVSSDEAGITATPIFMVASMTSQIWTQLGSIISTRSPRFTPWWRRYMATRLERSASCA